MDEIITLAELKDWLQIQGVGRDKHLKLLRSGVDQFVRAKTKREWAEAIRTDEKYRGTDTDTLALAHYPSSLLTKVEVDGSALDHTDEDVVILRGDGGELLRTDGGVWYRLGHRPIIVVSYTGGIAPPTDLKMGAFELASYIWQTSGARVSIAVSGGVSMKFFDGCLDELPAVKSIIDYYTDWTDRVGSLTAI